MLSLIIILLIITFIFVYKFIKKHGRKNSWGEMGEGHVFLLAGIGIVIGILVLVWSTLFIGIVESSIYDDKIELYEEENAQIEEEIALIIAEYSEYEQETYEQLKTVSPTTLVTMYPELETNELVMKQIDLYISNQEEIKKMKEEQLSYEKAKWWLYFGGDVELIEKGE